MLQYADAPQRMARGRRKLLKQTNPALLSMLLGASSNVVTLQRAEGIRLREVRTLLTH